LADSAPISTLSIDLEAVLRRRKPDRRRAQLNPRATAELVRVDAVSGLPGRPALVPDTSVYIHQAAGRLAPAARALVEGALLSHCSVCLGELAVGLAGHDVTASNWSATRNHFGELFARIPSSRLLVPDTGVWIEAGVIAGTLARIQRFQPNQRQECLNDALIYLAAAGAGLPVLTANRRDFDLIQQLAPEGAFIFYEPL